MKFKWMKREQRKINHWVRGLNKNIENDPLWKGRFYVRQLGATSAYTYEDGSGGVMALRFELRDRLTGKTKIEYHDNYDYRWLGMEMNDFIVLDCKVWEQEPRITRENTPDFRGLPK